MGRKHIAVWRKRGPELWFVVLSICLLAAAFTGCRWKAQDTEYDVIQAIIEQIEAYQEEIESWGYQVSVLPRMAEEPESESLKRYYWEGAGPVLILTDTDGGMYCFYYGFDQYASEAAYPESVPVFYPRREYADALKIVRLQICKKDLQAAPLFENTAEPDSQDYYDMAVRLHIGFVSAESGEELNVLIEDAVHGYFTTYYCSNNFTDCKWYNGIDPASANRYSDSHIKYEYDAGQLLEYYWQGLTLQNRLTQLYRERQEE